MRTFSSLTIRLLFFVIYLILIGCSNQGHLISIDGEEIRVNGRYQTVAEVIEAADIVVGPNDFVSPEMNSTPPADEPIVIQQPSAIELTVDGQSATVWTFQANLGSFLAENEVTLTPSAQVWVDGDAIAATSLVDAPIGQTISVSTKQEVTIQDGQESISQKTSAATVGQALADAGIRLFTADRVEPSLKTRLYPGLRILIERATPVTVRLDGQQLEIRTNQASVANVLAKAGVGLIGQDESLPHLDQPVVSNDLIEVQRSATTYEVTESPFPFASRFQPVDTLEIDERTLLSAGAPGVASSVVRMDRVGANSVTHTVIGQWVSRPATDEIIGYGTDVVVRTVDTPSGPLSYWRVVRMYATAYTAADAGKPPSHPAYGITASGRPAGYGIVAVDPDVVPFRSQVYVPGYGVAFAGDTGGGVQGRWIDLGYDEGEIVSWNRYVDVYYLTPVPEPDRINFLIPTWLP